jgi:hypothetical protein
VAPEQAREVALVFSDQYGSHTRIVPPPGDNELTERSRNSEREVRRSCPS